MNISSIISITGAVFCLFMFFYLKWYIKHRTSDTKLLDEYRTEVNRLIVEVNAATDRDAQLVEDRIIKLKAILDDTDKRISVYIHELEKSRTGEALYTSLGRGIRAALDTQAVKTPPPEKKEEPKQYATSQEKMPPEAPQETPLQTQSKTHSKRQIRAQIDAMVEQGLSSGEIASRLEIGVAEVDLARNLINRQKKRS